MGKNFSANFVVVIFFIIIVFCKHFPNLRGCPPYPPPVNLRLLPLSPQIQNINYVVVWVVRISNKDTNKETNKWRILLQVTLLQNEKKIASGGIFLL